MYKPNCINVRPTSFHCRSVFFFRIFFFVAFSFNYFKLPVFQSFGTRRQNAKNTIKACIEVDICYWFVVRYSFSSLIWIKWYSGGSEFTIPPQQNSDTCTKHIFFSSFRDYTRGQQANNHLLYSLQSSPDTFAWRLTADQRYSLLSVIGIWGHVLRSSFEASGGQTYLEDVAAGLQRCDFSFGWSCTIAAGAGLPREEGSDMGCRTATTALSAIRLQKRCITSC